MTKDEELRLALEALENLGNHDHVCPQWPTYAEPENYPKCNCGYDQAITAIKAALEAKCEPVVWNEGVPAMLPKQKEGETFIVSYEPKQEAKDEPVAWCVTYNGELTGNIFENRRIADLCKRNLEAKYGSEESREVVPIYTTPPQRTWVGLTDDEQQQAYEQWQNDGWGVFYNAIEAKLKEKNT